MIPIPIPMPVQPPRDLPRPLSPAEILSNRASALYYAGRTEEAMHLAFQSVDMEHTVTTLNNLAVILETLGRHDEAFQYALEAFVLDPCDLRIAKLYGESLLRRGDLVEGWPIYAFAHTHYPWLEPHVPEWRGESLRNKRLVVFAHGGYGDNIYFLRWLVWLRESGVDLVYLAPPTLAPLSRAMGIPSVENYNGNFSLDLRRFDYHTLTHAIPQHLGVTFNSPSLVPYVKVPARPLFHLRRRIGFCWRAGEEASPRRTRTLNWDQRRRITSSIPRHIGLSNLTGSWLDTACLIASLDHVITVDTGVCHLACALGIPTSVLLPGAAAWHYPTNRQHHPFYPTLRMFRNDGEGLDHAVDSLVETL